MKENALWILSVALLVPVAIYLYLTIFDALGPTLEKMVAWIKRVLLGIKGSEIGVETMIGKELQATSAAAETDSEGQYTGAANYRSERWTIKSGQRFHLGQTIRVIAVSGAILHVEPVLHQ